MDDVTKIVERMEKPFDVVKEEIGDMWDHAGDIEDTIERGKKNLEWKLSEIRRAMIEFCFEEGTKGSAEFVLSAETIGARFDDVFPEGVNWKTWRTRLEERVVGRRFVCVDVFAEGEIQVGLKFVPRIDAHQTDLLC